MTKDQLLQGLLANQKIKRLEATLRVLEHKEVFAYSSFPLALYPDLLDNYLDEIEHRIKDDIDSLEEELSCV